MTFETLSDDQVDAFISKLRQGMVWTNGLVGHITLYYKDGQFIWEGRDTREPDVPPVVRRYSEEEFRAYLQKTRFPDFVYKHLIDRLQDA